MEKKSPSSSAGSVRKNPKVPKHRAPVVNMEKKSPSSSAEPVRRIISPKDRKHRAVVKGCVNGLMNFFFIVTGIELPKGCWEKVIQVVWGKIFEARKLEQRLKVSMKLEEYAARATQVVKIMCNVLGKAKSEANEMEVSMQPLQQQFLNQDYSQHGLSSVIQSQILEEGRVESSMQLREYIAKFDHTEKNKGATVVEAEVELKNLESLVEPLLRYLRNQDCPKCHKRHGIVFDDLTCLDSNHNGKDTKAEKILGHLLPVVEGAGSPNHRSAENQISSSYPHQSDLNNKPQDFKPKTQNSKHLMRKKMWKKAEGLIERKINDASEEGKKVKAMIQLRITTAGIDQIVKDMLASFEDAKKSVEEFKYWLQLVEFGQKIFQNHGASSEDVLLDVEDQGLGFNSPLLAGPIENGQSSGINEQKRIDFVHEDLQNPMLATWRATGCSGGTVSSVEPEAAASLSSVGESSTTFACCGELVENKIFLMQLIKLFPEIQEDGFKEVLLKMANPPRLEVKDSDENLESMNPRASDTSGSEQMSQKMGALQAKRKRKRCGYGCQEVEKWSC